MCTSPGHPDAPAAPRGRILSPSSDDRPARGDIPTMREIQVGSEKETVIERADYPPEKIKSILGHEVVAVIGYGVQGPGQALNMRDNGVNVIIGQRPNSKSWDKAVAEGWEPGQSLFPMEEAAAK